jgi:indole-3-glycerol phosphate synthase
VCFNWGKDVQEYLGQGVKAFLVGEALMRAENPKVFIDELLSVS